MRTEGAGEHASPAVRRAVCLCHLPPERSPPPFLQLQKGMSGRGSGPTDRKAGEWLEGGLVGLGTGGVWEGGVGGRGSVASALSLCLFPSVRCRWLLRGEAGRSVSVLMSVADARRLRQCQAGWSRDRRQGWPRQRTRRRPWPWRRTWWRTWCGPNDPLLSTQSSASPCAHRSLTCWVASLRCVALCPGERSERAPVRH